MELIDRQRVLEIAARGLDHGRWLEIYSLPIIKRDRAFLRLSDNGIDCWCERCGSAFELEVADVFFNYCPYCGAEFIKEGEDE